MPIAKLQKQSLTLKRPFPSCLILKKEVEKIHSYSIPCIVKIPVSSNKKYLDWLESEIKE
ncbi:MAG TPA: divalent cation tolerance protein CutA [Thermoplasmata archaeon]|nr:divalent cation tolerance protein CutA [Thermoplasmata archaeon]